MRSLGCSRGDVTKQRSMARSTLRAKQKSYRAHERVSDGPQSPWRLKILVKLNLRWAGIKRTTVRQSHDSLRILSPVD